MVLMCQHVTVMVVHLYNYVASQNGHTEVVSLLLKRGVGVSA